MTATAVFTLKAGDNAKCLTTSAGDADDPTILINEGTDRAYVAGDYSVSPNNATPIEPGTSTSWVTPGEIWAIADPAAAAPVTVRLTDDVADYTPSPYALAAATAAKLLATGVPQVLIEDKIYDSSVPANATTGFVDCTRYSSLVVFINGNGNSGASFDTILQQLVTVGLGGGGLYLRKDRLQAVNASVGGGAVYRVSVEGDAIAINNLDTLPHTYQIYGSNRPAPSRVGSLRSSVASEFERWALTSQAFTAGQQVAMTRQDQSARVSQGGECDVYATLGSTTTVTAAQIIMLDSNGQPVLAADTKDPNAFTDSGNLLRCNRRIFVPPGATFIYQARVAATFGPSIFLSFRP